VHAVDERLDRILAVTDATLSGLDTEDLLAELLERVRGLLAVDTATILLLEPDSQHLAAVAAVGLEEEVRQGFRIELGVGFAGRVARDRTPVVIDVDETTVVNPILLDKGISTLLGVPMVTAGELVGVLHVGSYEPRTFDPADVTLLQMVADRAALASQASRYRTERTATLALQHSLLPTQLPHAEGLEMAARYVPGHRFAVGGDWYDVFHLPSGHLGVVVGDVSGHGLRAAVVMGRLRSALRAYALESEDPADVLTRLDRKIRHFEAGNLATILYAMIAPRRDRMTVTLAGHPPPVLAVAEEPARLLSVPVDLPVGIDAAQKRRNTHVELGDDATVVVYTDGLIERRGQIIDAGLQRLCDAVRPGPAETLCSSIMARMQIEQAEDDVAFLCLRRTAR